MQPATLTASKEELATMVLHDHEQAWGFDFRKYVRELPWAKSEIAKKLHISVAKLESYMDKGEVPRAVWRLCVNTYGRGKVSDPKIRKARRAYRLPAAVYAPLLKVTITAPVPDPPPAPVVPPPAPRPESVSWAVFEHATMLLCHQNTALSAENAVVNADNLRLTQQVDMLQLQIAIMRGEKQFDSVTSKALDVVKPISVEQNDTHAEVMSHLGSLSHLNGNGVVLADLMKRVRPSTAPRH
jgi:hypothetical protein